MISMRQSSRSTRSCQSCSRCKERKIKCDGSKPACLACQNSGYKCPGFAPRYKWVRKHEVWPRTEDPAQSAGTVSCAEAVQQSTANGKGDSSAVQVAPTRTSNDNDSETVSLTEDHAMTESDFLHWLDYEDSAARDGNIAINLPFSPINPFGISPDSGWDWFTRVSDISQPTYRGETTHDELAGQMRAAENESSLSQAAIGPLREGHLLESFYRLSIPIAPKARFTSAHLVQHYFAEVCPLYSCFDSELNPFRTLVDELWQSSKTVFCTIQSMAMANLSNHYPYIEPHLLRERGKAWKSLQLDLRLFANGKLPLETVLVSLLLLGLSATWHRPCNLGLEYLYTARTLMRAQLRSNLNGQQSKVLPHERFFYDALMYWEMLASFVEPVPKMTFAGYGQPIPRIPTEQVRKLPHSWAGLNTELHFVLAETGRILRGRQSLAPCAYHALGHSHDQCEYEEEWARSLDRFVCSVQIPGEDDVLEYSDANTPKTDLIRAAHAQRYISLMEIYRAFPRLLDERISSRKTFPAAFDQDFVTPTDKPGYSDTHHSWLFAIATQSLEMLKVTSISSAACRLHPLILISCACQLRLPDEDQQEKAQDEVIDRRAFVETRILALSRKYPEKPLLQMLETVKEVWQRLDDGAGNTHWLDVAHEKGWQTMMG